MAAGGIDKASTASKCGNGESLAHSVCAPFDNVVGCAYAAREPAKGLGQAMGRLD